MRPLCAALYVEGTLPFPHSSHSPSLLCCPLSSPIEEGTRKSALTEGTTTARPAEHPWDVQLCSASYKVTRRLLTVADHSCDLSLSCLRRPYASVFAFCGTRVSEPSAQVNGWVLAGADFEKVSNMAPNPDGTRHVTVRYAVVIQSSRNLKLLPVSGTALGQGTVSTTSEDLFWISWYRDRSNCFRLTLHLGAWLVGRLLCVARPPRRMTT